LLNYFIITAIGLAFLFSLLSFRLNYPWHLRLFSVLLGVTLVVEWFAIFGIHVFRSSTNVPLYNIFMLVEFWVYGFYYKQIIRIPWMQKVIRYFLVVYPLYWLVTTLFLFGLFHWNSYVVLFGSFFTICFSAVYYYQIFTSEPLITLTRHTEFWIATGMILFYAANLPYLGILSYLVQNYQMLARALLVLLGWLSVTMYLIFSLAYVCRITTRKY
jgi:hypothetical protein